MSVEFMKTPVGLRQVDRWFVCPTQELRSLIYRNRTRLVPGCNYICEWKDAHGFGIHITVAAWVQPGQIYHVPN